MIYLGWSESVLPRMLLDHLSLRSESVQRTVFHFNNMTGKIHLV